MPTTLTQITANSFELWETHPLAHNALSHPEWPVTAASTVAVNRFRETGTVSAGIVSAIEQRIEERNWAPQADPAREFDAIDIPNGIYCLSSDTESVYYKIYTVQSGQWVGRRVIKFFHADNPSRDSHYAAFAFLNCDGTFTLWSRFEGRESEAFIRFAPLLLQRIGIHFRNGDIGIGGCPSSSTAFNLSASGERNILRWTILCRSCNAEISDDTVIRQHCPSCRSRAYSGLIPAEYVYGTTEAPASAESLILARLARCEVTGTEIR